MEVSSADVGQCLVDSPALGLCQAALRRLPFDGHVVGDDVSPALAVALLTCRRQELMKVSHVKKPRFEPAAPDGRVCVADGPGAAQTAEHSQLVGDVLPGDTAKRLIRELDRLTHMSS